MFKVHWEQHPVGHGGFHTGLAEIERLVELSWVYDCGSRATQRLESYLKAWNDKRKTPIDWLFVSHFDADHVSGLQTLLHPARVRQVMLPYVNDDEMVVSLLHAIARDRLDRPMTELMADPTRFFRDRGVARVIYVGPGGEGAGEPGPAEPDGPQRDGEWKIHMKPGRLKALRPDPGNHDSLSKVAQSIPPEAEYWPGGGELVIEHKGLGVRFVPYRAPTGSSAGANLLSQLAQLVGMPPLPSQPVIGLGLLAMAAARLAMTEAGRKSLVALYQAHAKSSNRASMSLLTMPVMPRVHPSYWSVQGGHRWESGSKPLPAWLNTGDAELLDPADLHDWQARYRQYLRKVRVLSLPHHGSDYNSDSSLYRLAPAAILTAQVKHNALKHPGPTTKLAAGNRLVRVSGDPNSAVEMNFETF